MDAGGRATQGAVAEAKQKKVSRLSVREPTLKQSVAIATPVILKYRQRSLLLVCLTSVINFVDPILLFAAAPTKLIFNCIVYPKR